MSMIAVLRAAASDIGYVEVGNNITKYWAKWKPSWQGQPYCAAGLSDWLDRGGELGVFDGKPIFYCPSIEGLAKSKNRWFSDPAVGDIVLYSFGAAEAIHVGIVEKVNADTIQTIEANTSPGTGGSQNNGGGVYRRVRTRNWGIRGYYRPAYKPAPKPVTPTGPQPYPYELHVGAKNRYVGWLQTRLNALLSPSPRLVVDNEYGPATKAAVVAWQKQRPSLRDPEGVVRQATWASIFGGPAGSNAPVPVKDSRITPVDLAVDGVLGSLTVRAINRWTGRGDTSRWDYQAKVALQRKVGAKPDGVVGRNTIIALQTVVGAKRDGGWGPLTTRAIQAYLNAR